MKNFIDTVTNKRWAFDDEVVVKKGEDGVHSFFAPDGSQLNAPQTLVPTVIDPPSEAQLLADSKTMQVSLVNAACGAYILQGFRSSALGAAHDYPSQDVDQRNLQSAVSASIGADELWKTLIWCSDGGAWALVEHTATQIRAVNTDWLKFRVAAQRRYADLVGKINAALTVSAVQTISWE